MPWRIRRLLILMCCGFGALALAVIVAARDTSIDTELLAWLGMLGGVAIIVTNLPDNGGGK